MTVHVGFGYLHGAVEGPLRIFWRGFAAVAGGDEEAAGLTLKVTLRVELFADAVVDDH